MGPVCLFLVPYLTVGYDILRKAALGVKNKKVFDECFLMTVATLGAIALGEYGEGVAVMLLYQVGELFQSVAVGKSRRSISALMDIRPDYANIEADDGSLEKVDPDEVDVGSLIVVQPGERVPIDGVVVEGSSALDTAALTGESRPSAVGVDDTVLSGSINLSGVLKVRTTAAFEESTASKILDLVENAAARKSKSENLHLQIRPGLYAHRLLFGPGSGPAAAPVPADYRGEHDRRLAGLAPSGLHVPGHQLPLRRGHQRAAELLRGPGRRQQPGHPHQGLQLSGDPGREPPWPSTRPAPSPRATLRSLPSITTPWSGSGCWSWRPWPNAIPLTPSA